MLGTLCRGVQHIPWVYTHSALCQQHLSWETDQIQSLADVLQLAPGELSCWVTFISQGEGNTNRDGTWRAVQRHKSAGGLKLMSYGTTNQWVPKPTKFSSETSSIASLPLSATTCHYLLFLWLPAYPILFSQISSPSHLTVPSCVPLLVPSYIFCARCLFLSCAGNQGRYLISAR